MGWIEALEVALDQLGEKSDVRTRVENLRENPTSVQLALIALEQARGDLMVIAQSGLTQESQAELLPNTAVVIQGGKAKNLPALDQLTESKASFDYWLRRALEDVIFASQQPRADESPRPRPGLPEIQGLTDIEGRVTAAIFMFYTEMLYQRSRFDSAQKLFFFRALLEMVAVNQSGSELFGDLRALFTERNGFSPALVQAVSGGTLSPQARSLLAS